MIRPFRVEVREEEQAELGKGNHFAAWQELNLFTTELRAAFRSIALIFATNQVRRIIPSSASRPPP